MKEVNFRDRVPTYPGRVTLEQVPGKNNTFVMARADEPVEEGTPIDRAAFQSIVQSRLNGRYYPVTAASTIFDSAISTVSPIPKSTWVLNGNTVATSGGYKLTASSVSVADYSVEKATDGKSNTSWSSADGTNHTYTIQLPVALEVKKIKFQLGQTGSGYFRTTFQGSTDGTTWNDLLTISEVPSELKEYTLSNTADFMYYRFKFERGSSSRCYIIEFEFSEYVNNTHINIFTSDEMPATWEVGQIVLIQMPYMQITSVIANIFNGIMCNTVLQSNKRYELRYNGKSFDAKEV